MGEEMTEEQAQEMLRDFAEQKQTQHSFFTNVIKSEDTTKTGNLNDEEIGTPDLPERSNKELALFCEDVWEQKDWADLFKKKAEILTSTSLSKDALLLKLAVTNKKEMADLTPSKKKENKGWFKKKR